MSKKQIEVKEEEKEICSICQEKINKTSFTTECKHTFCCQCMFSWIKQQGSENAVKTCPMCRQELKTIPVFNPYTNELFDLSEVKGFTLFVNYNTKTGMLDRECISDKDFNKKIYIDQLNGKHDVYSDNWVYHVNSKKVKAETFFRHFKTKNFFQVETLKDIFGRRCCNYSEPDCECGDYTECEDCGVCICECDCENEECDCDENCENCGCVCHEEHVCENCGGTLEESEHGSLPSSTPSSTPT